MGGCVEVVFPIISLTYSESAVRTRPLMKLAAAELDFSHRSFTLFQWSVWNESWMWRTYIYIYIYIYSTVHPPPKLFKGFILNLVFGSTLKAVKRNSCKSVSVHYNPYLTLRSYLSLLNFSTTVNRIEWVIRVIKHDDPIMIHAVFLKRWTYSIFVTKYKSSYISVV
jgi:hypothetical protein